MNSVLTSELTKDTNSEITQQPLSSEPSGKQSPKHEVAYIYTLSDPRTGFARYVGKAFNLRDRFYGHWHDRGNTPKTGWIKSLKKLRIKPVIEVLEMLETSNSDDWDEAERFWIQSLRFSGCDLLTVEDGGNGGKRLKESTKIKIGLKSSMHRHSLRTKALISAKSKAAMTPEARANLSRIFKGRKHTEEVKKFISASKIGKPRPEHVRRKLLAHSILAKFKRGCVTPDYQKEIVLSVLGVAI